MYRVLLVEDEEIIRKGIRYSVPWEEYGCSVVAEAENGAVGEEKIAELRPDIVITDITMPVKSGLEMIADTREEYKYIAIILTGYSEFEYAQQAIRNGRFSKEGIVFFLCQFTLTEGQTFSTNFLGLWE